MFCFQVRDPSIFMSAVIDAKSFARIKKYIDYARSGNSDAKLIFGGMCDDSKGYFVQPTCVEVTKLDSKLLTEEIFGPVLTAYVYPDDEAEVVLRKLKDATQFGLTGAVFAQDQYVIFVYTFIVSKFFFFVENSFSWLAMFFAMQSEICI